MEIRTYRPGDEVAQVGIYNEAAGELPKFKAATLDEVRRRVHGPDYDPTTRFLALVDGRLVGYAGFAATGRVSFPWCRKGHEAAAQPLLERVVQTMKERGLSRAFAAYRTDWTAAQQFFQNNGFQQRREMVNYVLDIVEMPTPMARPNSSIEKATVEDVPAILEMGAGILLIRERAALEQYLFHNPRFPADSVFVLRNRTGGTALAAAILVADPAYADPRQGRFRHAVFSAGRFRHRGDVYQAHQWLIQLPGCGVARHPSARPRSDGICGP